MYYIVLFFRNVFLLPSYTMYKLFDRFTYNYYHKKLLFEGWGIHLFTGKFGAGKTMYMTILAYKLAVRFPQLTILTNYELHNFPKHTKILPLDSIDDILKCSF